MKENIQRIHFIGVCGTAMGAVASAMKKRGFHITGSDDKVYQPMSGFLEGQGIEILSPYSPGNISASSPDLVVVGNVVGRGNAELEEVLSRRLSYCSLPEFLRRFCLHGKHNLVVAGTHGKTTTASLLTHILRAGKKDPAWMIGGIAADLGAGASLHDSDHVVLEGDEYDTCFYDKGPKFAHYLPELAIINNMELDQMDVYSSMDTVKRVFGLLIRVLPENGILLYNADCRDTVEVANTARAATKISVGLNGNATVPITNLVLHADGARFEIEGVPYELPMHGEFNVRNAAMAILAASRYGVKPSVIQAAVGNFQGVLRRQNLIGARRGIQIIEDFGKHPTNIRETLKALSHRFAGARVWAIVDPRANTMCRAEIQPLLLEALRHAHGAIIAPIDRPERFGAGEALDPAQLTRDLTGLGHPSFAEPGVDAIIARLDSEGRSGDVAVLFSSGSFGEIYRKILQ